MNQSFWKTGKRPAGRREAVRPIPPLRPGALLTAFLFAVLGIPLLSSALQAQRVLTYPVAQQPWLTSNQAVAGKEIRIRLNNASPGANVVWYIGLLDEEQARKVREAGATAESTASLENLSLAQVAQVDPQGVCDLEIPRANPDWVGRTGLVRAVIQEPQSPEPSQTVVLLFTVRNPSLYFPLQTSGAGGAVGRYDEAEGSLSLDYTQIYGTPRKILFSPDGRYCFVMLDGGRIAVLDSHSGEREPSLFLGDGLVDMALMPDDRHLVALTHGPGDAFAGGKLWIFDLRDLGAPPRDLPVGAIREGQENGMLQANKDASLLFIREAGLDLVKYSFVSGNLEPLRLGTAKHFKGEIRDMDIVGNSLLALIALRDLSSDLVAVNLQVDQQPPIIMPAGKNPRKFQRLPRENGLPLYTMVDQAGEGEDVLRILDVDKQVEVGRILLPDGVEDFDLDGARGLGLVLCRDGALEEGSLVLVDLARRKAVQSTPMFPLAGSARVRLSRSEELNRGFVWSDEGRLLVIDLAPLRVEDQVWLGGACTGLPVEIH